MFGMGFTEIVLVLAIALVVLGPDRLPGIAKALGKALREFRRATREIQTSFEVEEVRRTIRERQEKSEGEAGPVLDPKTGQPIPDAPDDLAEHKARLGDIQGPALVRRPRRPTVAATGSSVTAGKPSSTEAPAVSEELEVSIEPPSPRAAPSGGQMAHRGNRDEGNGEAGEPAESLASKPDGN